MLRLAGRRRRLLIMEQPSTTDRTSKGRPARRRLTGPHPLVTPSTRAEMIKAYNQNYVSNLRSSGTPTRRELAEAVLQAVIEQITGNPKVATIPFVKPRSEEHKSELQSPCN